MGGHWGTFFIGGPRPPWPPVEPPPREREGRLVSVAQQQIEPRGPEETTDHWIQRITFDAETNGQRDRRRRRTTQYLLRSLSGGEGNKWKQK